MLSSLPFPFGVGWWVCDWPGKKDIKIKQTTRLQKEVAFLIVAALLAGETLSHQASVGQVFFLDHLQQHP